MASTFAAERAIVVEAGNQHRCASAEKLLPANRKQLVREDAARTRGPLEPDPGDSEPLSTDDRG
jgi:hypothetical protein